MRVTRRFTANQWPGTLQAILKRVGCTAASQGSDKKARADLRKVLGMITSDENPYAPEHSPGCERWVQPILLAEVSFAEWTKVGKVRHSVLHGVRPASQ